MGAPKTDPFAAIAEDPFANIAEGAQLVASHPQKPAGMTDAEWYAQLGSMNRFASSASSGFGIPVSVQRNPIEAARGLKLAVSHPSLLIDSAAKLYENAEESTQQLLDRAYNLQHIQSGVGAKAKAFGIGLASLFPMVGPAVVSAVDQINNGDIAGGYGSIFSLGSQFLAPKAAGAIAGKVIGAPPVAAVGEGGVSSVGTMGTPLKELLPSMEGAKTSVRRTLQNVTGAAPENTSEKLITEYRKDLKTATEKQAEADAATAKANRDTTVNALEEAKRREAAHKEATAQQALEHKQKVDEAVAHNQQQAATIQRQVDLTKQIDQQSVDLGKRIQDAEAKAYQQGDALFNTVRQKVGNTTVPSDPLIDSVKSAQTNILQDIPENVKEFKSILGMEGGQELGQLRKDVMTGQGMTGDYDALSPERKAVVDDLVKRYGGQATPNEPVDWNYLQAIKSRIDARLRSRSPMNGDLKRALFSVRDTVVDEMGNIAKAADAKAAAAGVTGPTAMGTWQVARDFYREYKQDFHEPAGPSRSGSPLAQAYNAVDPMEIRKPFLRTEATTGNRGIDILTKYDPQAAQIARSIVDQTNELKSLKPQKPKPIPTAPAPLSGPEGVPVKMEPRTEVKMPNLPTEQELRDLKAKEVFRTGTGMKRLTRFDAMIAGASMLEMMAGDWRRIMYGVPVIVGEKMLGVGLTKRPMVNFISAPLPEELAAFRDLPKDVSTTVRQKMNEFIAQQKKAGVPVPVDPRVGALLAGRLGSKTPAEQKKDLEAIQQKYQTGNPMLPINNEQ